MHSYEALNILIVHTLCAETSCSNTVLIFKPPLRCVTVIKEISVAYMMKLYDTGYQVSRNNSGLRERLKGVKFQTDNSKQTVDSELRVYKLFQPSFSER